MTVNFRPTPKEVCENLLHQIKTSKLNFQLLETPYSVNICIRKTFLKEFSRDLTTPGLNDSSNIIENANKSDPFEEVEKLKQSLAASEAEKQKCKQVIDILESKLEKAESELFNHFNGTKELQKVIEKEKQGAAVLKGVINKVNKEISKNRSDLNSMAKSQKRNLTMWRKKI